MSSSQKALEDLLEEIINDRTMTALKRKQRLKKVEFRGHMLWLLSNYCCHSSFDYTESKETHSDNPERQFKLVCFVAIDLIYALNGG